MAKNRRNLNELIKEAFKLAKGLLLRFRFKSCGLLLRAGSGVRILKKMLRYMQGVRFSFIGMLSLVYGAQTAVRYSKSEIIRQ